ncbi:polysaccharide pyruvyl transferase family protein [Microbacterium indicum]|uniref:polysaccharide pyruvyl transferase family protein n=1 Tax=Microbacterium indicum TaxID=358100 RepID=UPI001B7FA4D4|nr:polysaccharide pyruvyl transferase family protein [Microbacterium indicum]
MSEAARVRPRVGIAGSFGRGNYGDELYVKTYEHWFGEWADVHMLAGLPSQAYLTQFADSYVDLMDAVVLGGGDLICPYASRVSHDFVNPAYLRRPVHVAGIGVQANRPEVDPAILDRWKLFLTDPAIASITTRDEGSRGWIEEYLNVSVPISSHPDLVCALPLPRATAPAGAPIVGLVTRHVQSGDNYAQLAEIARELKSRGWRVRHIIGSVGAHGKKDLENSKLLQVDDKETVCVEDLDEISRALGECSLVLSMKLHTTIVASMYGVPTVAVNPVVKAKQFMRALEREDLVFHPLDPALRARVLNGVEAPDAGRVSALREGASAAMRALGQSIWETFRSGSPIRAMLPTSPPRG